MHVELIGQVGSWRAVADAAMTTVHKSPGEGEPSDFWKRCCAVTKPTKKNGRAGHVAPIPTQQSLGPIFEGASDVSASTT